MLQILIKNNKIVLKVLNKHKKPLCKFQVNKLQLKVILFLTNIIYFYMSIKLQYIPL